MHMNFATSAAGSVRVELQDATGKPMPGFSAADCPPIFGDHLQHTVHWQGGSDLGAMTMPVRIKFLLEDADLFAFGFTSGGRE